MKVFVSYAHEDLDRVRELVDILIASRSVVLFDDLLLPGQDWKHELELLISDCDTFLYALTGAAISSEWCQWEFASAVRLQKSVIPVLLELGLILPDSLRYLQYADFTQGATPIIVAKLMGGLLAQKVPMTEAPTIPADPKGIPSRAWENAGHWTDAYIKLRHQPENEQETIIKTFAVNLFRGIEGVGGRLILTNQRLLFEAHGMNVQSGPLAIPLDEVDEVTPSRSFGVIPNCMTIRCRSGESYKFVVSNRGDIIEIIKEHLELRH